MSDAQLDQEIAEAVGDLMENQEEQSVISVPAELISQNIMDKVNWETFQFHPYTAVYDEGISDTWIDRVNRWFQDLDEGGQEVRRAGLAYYVIKQELVGQAYRERRKARSKDPERKLRNKLVKAEQKMRKLEEERKEIIAQQQAVARSRQVRQARSDNGSAVQED